MPELYCFTCDSFDCNPQSVFDENIIISAEGSQLGDLLSGLQFCESVQPTLTERGANNIRVCWRHRPGRGGLTRRWRCPYNCRFAITNRSSTQHPHVWNNNKKFRHNRLISNFPAFQECCARRYNTGRCSSSSRKSSRRSVERQSRRF